MIRFGAWSTLLAVLAAQALVLAALLLATRTNRLANRYLAALLAVIVGMLTPFVLGYAGFYDAYPWLTSAPLALPLAVGPLLYAYVKALVDGRALSIVHLMPAGLQFVYQAALFPFPVATKWWWAEAVHAPLVGPIVSLAVLVSMSLYLAAAWRCLRRYRDWLTGRRRSTRPARHIRIAAAFLALLLAARAAYELFDTLVRPIDYFELFGFYVLLAVSALLLGLNGWSSSADEVPAIAEAPERDWAAQGAAWLEQLREAGWWRDPELDLSGLARRLGTNTSHLSRALNHGHGGFATALSSIRAEEVAAAITAGAGDDLLGLAMDAGFGSKASFNRAFRARFGMSPSEYRLEAERLTA